MSRSDRYFDLTLRILMLAVAVALLGCVMFLVQRWSRPAPADTSLVQLVQAPAPAVAVPLPARAEATQAQVLHVPGRIFRCENNGRVSYTDQPCRPGTESPSH